MRREIYRIEQVDQTPLDNCKIGARIKERRNELKMTREVCSECIGISSRFLADIECGDRGFSKTTLNRISQALGITAEYILMGKPIVDVDFVVKETLEESIMYFLQEDHEKQLRIIEELIKIHSKK